MPGTHGVPESVPEFNPINDARRQTGRYAPRNRPYATLLGKGLAIGAPRNCIGERQGGDVWSV